MSGRVREAFEESLAVCRELRGTTAGLAYQRLLEDTVEALKEDFVSAEPEHWPGIHGAIQTVRNLLATLSREPVTGETETFIS